MELRSPINNAQLAGESVSNLAHAGYVTLPAHVGLTEAEHASLVSALFAEGQLERDLPDVHQSRERIDDLLHFNWEGECVDVVAAPGNHPDPKRIRLDMTRNFFNPRDYKRFDALAIDSARRLLAMVLHLVPPSMRREAGQVGIYALRTHGLVVGDWHRDGNRKSPVDWVASYVVSRRGRGGASQLARDRKGADLVTSRELAPGELIMHADLQYYHYVTPLEGSESEPPQREVIVIVVRPPMAAATS
jgi:hypothetical protein